MSRILLRHADALYTCDDARRVVRDAYLLMEGTRIAAVGADLAQRLRPVMGSRLDTVIDSPDMLFPKLERVLARYHDTSDGAMLQVAIGPTTVTYAQPQWMRRFADIARTHACGLHVHFDPRPDERTLMAQRHSRPID